MRHNYELKSNIIRVLVSSSMKEPIDRELRQAVKAVLDRFELYECKIIETVSDTQSMRQKCRMLVEWADVVILVLQRDLREGVKDEFFHAMGKGKQIFPFYNPENASAELDSFVREEVREELNTDRGTVCPEFRNTGQLIDLIEESLLEHLAGTYRGCLKRIAKEMLERKGLKKAPGMKHRPSIFPET